MKTRESFPAMLTMLGLTDVAVEVGTYRADFAKWWLQHWPGTLVCVDAWTHFDNSPDILNHPQAEMDAAYAEALMRLTPFEYRCAVKRMLSLDAAKLFADEGRSFDCVYLDAAHDYDSVVADISAWYPRVRHGGVLAGHDYLDGLAKDGFPADFGVKSAVDEFVARETLDLHVTTHEGAPTWWVIKP